MDQNGASIRVHLTEGDGTLPQSPGCCLRPARASCCGCTLQSGVYISALLALVVGSLSILGVITRAGTIGVLIGSIESVIPFLQICFGVTAWKAAADLSERAAQYSLILLSLVSVLSISRSVLLFCFSLSPSYCLFFIKHLEERMEATRGHPLSVEEIKKLHDESDVICGSVSAMHALDSIFLCVFLPYLCYVVWSFKIRIHLRETFLVTTGIDSLPLVGTNQSSTPVWHVPPHRPLTDLLPTGEDAVAPAQNTQVRRGFCDDHCKGVVVNMFPTPLTNAGVVGAASSGAGGRGELDREEAEAVQMRELSRSGISSQQQTTNNIDRPPQ